MWSSHLRMSLESRSASTELRQIRAKLAERLYAIKQLLCRVGREGRWRSWLKERQIPRSSADRWCQRHSETLDIGNKDAPIEAIEEQDSVEKLVQAFLPRLRSKLVGAQAVFKFTIAVAGAFGLLSTCDEDGVWVYLPQPETGTGSTPNADAPEPASAEVPSPEPENPPADGAVQGDTADTNGGGE